MGRVRGTDAIGLPYFDDKGVVTGYKLRSIEIPKREGAFSIIGKVSGLFGRHVFDPALGHATILEGEFDPLACYEAGLRNVLSIPHGAINPGTSGDTTKLAFLGDCEALFRGMKRIVVATDNDGPGKATGDEIARRIGRYRVYRPVYPDGAKDANDVLIDYGAEQLRKLIENSKAEEIPGLSTADAFRGDMMRFRRGEVMQGYSTGYQCLDSIFRITPGVFTSITGHPGSGKSQLVDQIHVNMAQRENWNFASWSRETPGFIHVAKLIEMFQRKRFHPDMNNVMSEKEIEAGYDKVQKHATFITSDGGPDTMESILERMTGAVMRYGIKSCVIDPYNYVQKNHEIAREDLQISEMLTLGTDWAKNHECHIFFVAHPKTTDEQKVPTGSSISGGATFWAKSDFGLTVHRPGNGRIAEVHCWKSKHSWLGKIGVCELGYDVDKASYYDLDSPFDDPVPRKGADIVDLQVVNGGRSSGRSFDDDDELDESEL
jgi:twinkle protein